MVIIRKSSDTERREKISVLENVLKELSNESRELKFDDYKERINKTEKKEGSNKKLKEGIAWISYNKGTHSMILKSWHIDYVPLLKEIGEAYEKKISKDNDDSKYEKKDLKEELIIEY